MNGLWKCSASTQHAEMCAMPIFFADLPVWGVALWHCASLKP